MANRLHPAADGQQRPGTRLAADPAPLIVRVDSRVHLSCDQTPKTIVEALRRQLRRHDVDRWLRHAGARQADVRLLWSEDGEYQLPQTLLAQVLEVCRRNNVPCSVRDERSTVGCARLRAASPLNAAQAAGLRQLLLRDGGVLIAREEGDRIAVAAELIARREQRTLVLTVAAAREALREAFARSFGSPPDLAPGADRASARVVVDDYGSVEVRGGTSTSAPYGFVVFDALEQVDPVAWARVLRGTSARYLLGLASAAVRADGLQGPLLFACGGVAHEIDTPRSARAARLAFRRRATSFSFDYSGREQYQALLTALAADEPRNRQIVGDVVAEVRGGHGCVVLSERRDQLEALVRLMPADVAQRSDTLTSGVRPGERHAITSRFAQGELDVLLATGQLASEALSMRRASRLFIAFPFSYGRKLERIIEQLLAPGEDKAEVVVFDYDDAQVGPLQRAFAKRSAIVLKLQRSADKVYQEWAQTTLNL